MGYGVWGYEVGGCGVWGYGVWEWYGVWGRPFLFCYSHHTPTLRSPLLSVHCPRTGCSGTWQALVDTALSSCVRLAIGGENLSSLGLVALNAQAGAIGSQFGPSSSQLFEGQ